MTFKLDQLTLMRASRPLQAKFAGAVDLGVVEGYASTFGGDPDSYGDIIAPGAFAKTLADHKAAGTLPVMLWAHDVRDPIGRWTDMGEDARGLYVRGQLNLETERGRDAHAHLKAGDVGAFSIGYSIAPGGLVTNQDGTTTLKQVNLFEVSVVAIPANPSARVTSVKSLQSQVDFERALREQFGLPRGAATKLAAGGWPALTNQKSEPINVAPLVARIADATRDLKKG